ncbi:MAG: pyruvate kinase [Cyanobacteria bacterium SW_9_44_58]|nr:MAG: pyruvate kinase [Cyanobacteria bacterium SW_9_44_58]
MSFKVNDFYDLEAIHPADQPAVGEKAIALSRLYQQGYPVPPAVVVGRHVLASLFPDTSQFNQNFNHYETLQQTAQQLSEQVQNADLGEEWLEQLYQKVATLEAETLILRPSLIAPVPASAVSGLLTSQCCFCNPTDLAWGLKQVWERLFRAPNLFYWQQQGIQWEQLGLAVMIQPIANAIASGILQVTEKQWQIQAVWGLGHSLVQGEVLPETYEIDPATGQWQLHQLGYQPRIYHLRGKESASLLTVSSPTEEPEKAVLTPEQLSQLINLATQLQETTSDPFRCEWTLVPQSYSKLYLTQFSVAKTSSPTFTVTTESTSHLIVQGIGSAKGQATGKVYVVGQDDNQGFPTGGILVAKRITTQTLPLMKAAGGLVAELGGITSHGAILARELNIPAVVGAQGAVEKLAREDKVTIDGDKGEVWRCSQQEDPPVEATSDAASEQPARENATLATQLMVNLSQRDRAAALAQSPVDGVGLLRSELMLLELLREQSLSTWLRSDYRETFIQQIARLIREFADAFFPRPIFYRSTDWLSVQQQDPMLLGERGTYSYVKNSDFFSAQMFALRALQDQGYSNINLILPFVRDVAEVKFCKTLLNDIGLAESCQIWMMAEVPSAVYLLPQYIEAGIDGIAIGTNDLTQLLLGVDREQGEFRDHYNERHPAVLAALKALIETAREQGIPCSICGQGVVLYPELVDQLVRWGITTISVEESAIRTVYRAIARSEKRLLLEAARQQHKS